MKRKFLFSFYQTPQGKLLQIQENNLLRRSITVSCKQTILQLGSLGWENDFIDFSLYHKYYILDGKDNEYAESVRVCANSYQLPIQSETIDLVLLPHLLEFDAYRFQTMREIERVMKPEADIIIINFNPLNIWVRMQILWDKKLSDSWRAHFITRSRILDWLKLLNFEVKTTYEFTLDSILTTPEQFKLGKRTVFSMAYAVRAVKRQYTLIPLTPLKSKSSRLVSATSGLNSSTHGKIKYD